MSGKRPFPHADLADDDVDDFTPITELSQAFQKIGQTSEMVRQLLHGELPDLREAVRGAHQAADAATQEAQLIRVQLDGIDRRVGSLEGEAREAREARLNGVTVKAQVAHLKDRVEKREKRGWGIWTLLVGSLIAVLTTAGSSLWYVRGMDKDIEHLNDQVEEHHPQDDGEAD